MPSLSEDKALKHKSDPTMSKQNFPETEALDTGPESEAPGFCEGFSAD